MKTFELQGLSQHRLELFFLILSNFIWNFPTSRFSNCHFQLNLSLRNYFELVIYFVLENFKIFTKLRLYKSTYGMTSRRLNLHLESRGSLRDKNFGEFRSKTTFTFCENHKKLSNLPLSPHSILQNWVDYLKVTSLRDNLYYPKMPTGQSGRPCSVGHSYTRESTDQNSSVFPEAAFL